MDHSSTPRRPPEGWIEAIEEGRADLAAGRVIDFEEVMADFDREDKSELATASVALPKQRRRTAKA